jgi:hypothetical protein
MNLPNFLRRAEPATLYGSLNRCRPAPKPQRRLRQAQVAALPHHSLKSPVCCAPQSRYSLNRKTRITTANGRKTLAAEEIRQPVTLRAIGAGNQYLACRDREQSGHRC